MVVIFVDGGAGGAGGCRHPPTSLVIISRRPLALELASLVFLLELQPYQA